MMNKVLPYGSVSLLATYLLLLGTELSAGSYELMPVKPYSLNENTVNQTGNILMVKLGDAVLIRDIFFKLLVINQLRAK